MKNLLLIITLLLITSRVSFGQQSEVEIIDVENVQILAQQAAHSEKIILLEFSSEYCSYCRTLEDNILKPMILSKEYPDVLIRRMDISDYNTIIDFDGKMSSGGDFASLHNVSVTPTLLFLNDQNEEVSKRIVGVNSLDFFGGYVDSALENGLTKIRQ